MLYFIIGVLLTSGVFLIFRAFESFKIDTFQAIVFNYLTCIVTGLLFLGDVSHLGNISFRDSWVWIAIVLGFLFISAFYLLGFTAQKVSVAASSIAAKISLIIPVLFNLWFLHEGHLAKLTFFNYLGLLLVFLAIVLTSVRPKTGNDTNPIKKSHLIVFPLLVFFMSGLIDTLLNYTNIRYIHSEANQAIFPLFIFCISAVIGLTLLLIKRPKIQLKNIIGGIFLGVSNYFSIYFLLKTLHTFQNNGAFVYPNFNISIIILSAILAVIIFKEKLLTINKIGIFVSVLAILLISYQEIINYLQNQ